MTESPRRNLAISLHRCRTGVIDMRNEPYPWASSSCPSMGLSSWNSQVGVAVALVLGPTPPQITAPDRVPTDVNMHKLTSAGLRDGGVRNQPHIPYPFPKGSAAGEPQQMGRRDRRTSSARHPTLSRILVRFGHRVALRQVLRIVAPWAQEWVADGATSCARIRLSRIPTWQRRRMADTMAEIRTSTNTWRLLASVRNMTVSQAQWALPWWDGLLEGRNSPPSRKPIRACATEKQTPP